MEKKHHKEGNWKSKLLILLILVVLLFNCWQIWQVNSVVDRVDKYNRGVIDEVGKVMGQTQLFANDLNEIRRFLLLPEREFATGQEKAAVEEDLNTENTVAAFAFLNSLAKEESQTKSKQLAMQTFDQLIANADFFKKLAESKILLGLKADLQVKFNDGLDILADGTKNIEFNQPLYNLVFDAELKAFKVQSALEEKSFNDYSDFNKFSADLSDYLVKNVDAVRQKKIAQKLESAQSELLAKKQQSDQLSGQKQELTNLVTDKAFVETLSTMGLKVSAQSRDENNKFIYDIVDQNNQLKFSLALEISSGMIKLLRDNQEIDLKSFLDTGSKKKP